MSKLDVRIVELPPMRVASALGFGPSPEGIAWEKLLKWAREKGVSTNPPARLFGFNNPNPSPGSPNYGYEQCVTVTDMIKGAGDIEVKELTGGLYAVTRCEGIHTVERTWREFAAWRETSPYPAGGHQWLEECLTPPGTEPEKMVLDLYLPIVGGK